MWIDWVTVESSTAAAFLLLVAHISLAVHQDQYEKLLAV
jgi:hypothetical protein